MVSFICWIMININLIRDLIQNKNFILLFVAVIFMGGILSCIQGLSGLYCIIFTLLLILFLYLRLFSIRKILIFALTFYAGFFLTFCKINNSDCLVPMAPVEAVFTGRIVSIPDSSGDGKVKFFFETSALNDKDIEKSKTLVTVSGIKPEDSRFNIGNKLTINGKLRLPFSAANPSQFDYGRYLRNFNVFTVLYADYEDTMLVNEKLPLKWRFFQELNNTRIKILKIHSKYLKSPGLEILGGIVFGDDAVSPPDEIKTSFINSGLLHILAASGMNVAFIFSFSFIILKFCRVPYRPRVIAGMLIVILYTFMTGLGASVVRASLMLLFVLCGKLIDRDAHNVALLSFVAMLMLIYNPAYICDVSFQLSFFVTLGLLTTAAIFTQKLSKIPDWIKVPVLIPVVAQFWVAPIQMFYFNTFTLYSVFANIVASPLLSVISFCGFITSVLLLVPKVFLPVCAVIDYLLNYLLVILVEVSNFFGGLKYSLLETTHPAVWHLVLYYLLLLSGTFLIKYNKYRHAVITFGIMLIIPFISVIHIPSKNLEIIAFDVQNADSFLIKTPQNKYFIIDTGKKSYGSKNSQAKIIMLKYLKDRGIKNIEGVIVTHFDNDHSGGAVDILAGTKTKNIYLNSVNKETQTSRGIFNYIDKTKQPYTLAENNKEIYKEPSLSIKTYRTHISGKNESNAGSIMTLLSYKDFDMLFMGDAGVESFNRIKNFMPSNVEVLKVGHHGGLGVVDDNMLKAISPEVSLISTGVNSFGHPNKGTLDLLRNTEILRTDLLKSIKISSDGNLYKIFTYNPSSKKYEFKKNFYSKK